MSDLIQKSLPVLTRFVWVLYILAIGGITVITITQVGQEWGGLSSAHTLMGTAGAALLAAVLGVEILRRTAQYIFLARPFFKGKPDLALKLSVVIPLLMLLTAVVLVPFALSARTDEQVAARTALQSRYDAAVAGLPGAEASWAVCTTKAKEVRRAQCVLTRNKIQSDYNFCLQYDSQASCLYSHNYTTYDCTSDTVKTPGFGSLFLTECINENRMVADLKAIITNYESI